MVTKIESMKSDYRVPLASLVSMSKTKLSCYMRWKQRLLLGKEPVKKPGTKKVHLMDLDELKKETGSLSNGKKRTSGTGPLYHFNRHGISRREFNEMVREVRRDHNRQKAASHCQVIWLRPDMTWALDGLEYENCHILNLQDLYSRCKFVHLTTGFHPCGEEIAGHLSQHFDRFGPPLFIKRDNGGNLYHTSVNELLEKMSVIPVYSPCNTASYNGTIEHSRGQLITWLRKWESN